jgi:hypothetical protein
MEKFQNEIKEWVNLDSQSKLLNEKLKDIRNRKNEISDNIFEFVETNNLSSSTIKISDGKLKFTQSKQTAPITLGFLETCLMDLFNNEDKVGEIMEFIKSKREIKFSSEIKRFYNN